MKLRSNKGITLIALMATLVVLLIITVTVVYNTKNHMDMKNLNNLYMDIEAINSKVNEYYLNYGELPVICEYLEKSRFQNLLNHNAGTEVSVNENDGDMYYVVDLEKLNALTLYYGYGQDYDEIKQNKGITTSDIETEIYIINGLTHQVYYPYGVFVDDIMYYTYELDEAIIDPSVGDLDGKELKSLDSINVTDDMGFVLDGAALITATLSDSTIATSNDVEWYSSDESVVSVTSNGIIICGDHTGIATITCKGSNKECRVTVTSQANKVYTNDTQQNRTVTGAKSGFVYNNPVIPVGFTAINTIDAKWNTNTVVQEDYNKGLVIMDSKGNQFVWVPINGDTVKYEKLTTAYTDDTLSDGTAISNVDTSTVFGGFWIGRYECGLDVDLGTAAQTTVDESVNAGYSGNPERNREGTPIIVEGASPWTCIDYINSQNNAESMHNTEYVRSGLVNATQWDTMCAWLYYIGGYNVTTADSSWSNYYDSELILDKFPYISTYVPTGGLLDCGAYWTYSETKAPMTTEQINSSIYGSLIRTGASTETKTLNLSDISGNVVEWSNEISDANGMYRGGGFYYHGRDPVASKISLGKQYLAWGLGFRTVLYVDKGDLNIQPNWEETSKENSNWYSYGGATVNEPKLTGGMNPIIYTDSTITGNRWANAITSDGSMFVWIPRYAYKITSNYHTNSAGTIQIKFIDTENNFLDGTTETVETEPNNITYTSNSQDQWLVHPAFTSTASNGGGFGELSGIWVGKFETTGTTAKISVKPATRSLTNININVMYLAAKNATFNEVATINSHMMKNSEWGAVVYLAQSSYGTNGTQIARNINNYLYTGGSKQLNIIYTTNVSQSTTLNPYGIYDLSGGAWEYMASYIYYSGMTGTAINYGGSSSGDLFGETDSERSTSTAYKTVYSSQNIQSTDYNTSVLKKGDAIYETSNSYSSDSGSWFSQYAKFPTSGDPFFLRSGGYSTTYAGSFYFSNGSGLAYTGSGFRVCLAF